MTTVSVEVARPAEEVFAHATDPTKFPAAPIRRAGGHSAR
jgi:hypothetical protein